MAADDNQLTRRMKLQMLEQKGKLFYKLAADFCGNEEWEDQQEHIIKVNKTFIKGHKQAITCLNWTQDNKYLITGSKDCSLIKCKFLLG
jgi:WD40 repeat protein